MSEEEDSDLLALQRQLDDAFETTRPRPAFAGELWGRLQSRRPIWQRFRAGLAGVVAGIREAPALPSAAVAIVLIVLVGAGIFNMSGLHLGRGAASTATNGAQAGATAPLAAPQYGDLPAPALAAGASRTAPLPGSASANSGLSASAVPNNIYFGPATLDWAGDLVLTATNLPVYRYLEPTRADADKFAASLQAAPAAGGAPGAYSGDNFTLVVAGSITQPAQEPSFTLSEVTSTPISLGGDPVAVAKAYLAAHGLIPTWPYQAAVQRVGDTVRVMLLRSFDVPNLGQVSLVDGVGDRYGIEVDLAAPPAGVRATGPLTLSLEAANYPIISADQAIRSALAQSASSAGPAAFPVVRLTQAELVYKLVLAGDQSFYEPAFLFSGTFALNGTTYVKRVLVPAVAPPLLSP
jgi:hypothetical protein